MLLTFNQKYQRIKISTYFEKTDHHEGDADKPTAETMTSYTDIIRHLFLSGSATNNTYGILASDVNNIQACRKN